MKYFRVKKEADNLVVYNNKIRSFLIGGELITMKEAEKMKITNILKNPINASIIEVSKFKTFFFFGARLLSHSERGKF